MGANISYENRGTKKPASCCANRGMIPENGYENRGITPANGYQNRGMIPAASGYQNRDITTQAKNYPPTKKAQVIEFHHSSKWEAHFEASKLTSKLTVVEFTATWCKPCQFIQPAINQFAEKYTDVDFIKIDVDELFEVAQEFGIRTMPTFILMKKGEIVDRVVGANKEKLQKNIEEHRDTGKEVDRANKEDLKIEKYLRL